MKKRCLLFLCRTCSICYSMDIDDSYLSVHCKIHLYHVSSRCCKTLNLSKRSWHQNWWNIQKYLALISFFLFQTRLEMSWLCFIKQMWTNITLIVSKIKVVKGSQKRIIKHSNWYFFSFEVLSLNSCSSLLVLTIFRI